MDAQISMKEMKEKARTLRPILAISDKRTRYAQMSVCEQEWGKQVFAKVQDYCLQTEWFAQTVEREEKDGNPNGKKAEFGMTKFEAESSAGWDFTMDSVKSVHYKQAPKEAAATPNRTQSKYAKMVARIAMSNTAA